MKRTSEEVIAEGVEDRGIESMKVIKSLSASSVGKKRRREKFAFKGIILLFRILGKLISIEEVQVQAHISFMVNSQICLLIECLSD